MQDPVTGELFTIYPPPCDCYQCSQQYRDEDSQKIDRFLYTRGLSEAEARKLMASYVRDTRADLQYVRTKLSCHGDTIRSRWTKKSRVKRATSLLEAMPGMYESRCPLFRLSYDDDFFRKHRTRTLRNTYLLPFLNLDSLKTNPMSFLHLLHYRTEHELDDWVLFDKEQIKFGWWSGYLEIEYSDCCLAMHGSKYGQLVPWVEDQAHRWDIFGLPLAR